FSGGIGLGAYQAGAYAALHQHQTLWPDWLAASSVGAVNAAVIAGNDAHVRIERLQQLWQATDAPNGSVASEAALAPWRHLQNWASVLQTRVLGMRGHFRPRYLSRPFEPFKSFYDLEPL